MFKDNRYINAGTNEFYRYGGKAQEKVLAAMTPNAAGFYSIPADGGKYWSFGTSTGKYGEYAKLGDVFFSVNRAGCLWAKAGTEKGDLFVQAMQALLNDMKATRSAGVTDEDEDEDE